MRTILPPRPRAPAPVGQSGDRLRTYQQRSSVRRVLTSACSNATMNVAYSTQARVGVALNMRSCDRVQSSPTSEKPCNLRARSAQACGPPALVVTCLRPPTPIIDPCSSDLGWNRLERPFTCVQRLLKFEHAQDLRDLGSRESGPTERHSVPRDSTEKVSSFECHQVRIRWFSWPPSQQAITILRHRSLLPWQTHQNLPHAYPVHLQLDSRPPAHHAIRASSPAWARQDRRSAQ